jgi:hypothetical protein
VRARQREHEQARELAAHGVFEPRVRRRTLLADDGEAFEEAQVPPLRL